MLTYSIFSLARAALQLLYKKNATVGSQHTFPLALAILLALTISLTLVYKFK